MGIKLYVGHLAGQASADDLTALFSGAGRVVHAHLITDRVTGQSKGFAFVEMANEAEALQAIALYNGHLLYDHALLVSEALPANFNPRSREGSDLIQSRTPNHLG